MPLVVIARWRASAEAQDRIAGLLPSFAALARSTPGCLGFEAVRSQSDPCSFLLIEHYADHSAFERRLRDTAYLQVMEEAVLPHLELRRRELYSPLG